MALRVYGHFASQPARAVLWMLKLKEVPHQFEKIEPLNGGTRTPEYASKFPTRQVPAIDDAGFRLAEASAIMKYIALKHGFEDMYPAGFGDQALIDYYLSWHHLNTRDCTRKVFKHVMVHTFFDKPWPEEDVAKGQASVARTMASLEECFLYHDGDGDAFIHGRSQPSIADLLCYAEIGQLLLVDLLDLSATPKVAAWAQRMEQLPMYEDVHRTSRKLSAMFKDKRGAAYSP
uniref:Glutathione transferase n=1 Tax=Phaeomonas parva TaxID=124430 RepID=A0A7S1UAU6_9STRA|mmetsp:Transcript_36785/g.115196  ORF Transcript_36785/g.115196 Transcript_36785/m.115196 type:complete len:232 (+) Transcript_36785:73-768(+)